MKNIIVENIKRRYITPEIIYIELDNEISLALESSLSDPEEPGMSLLGTEYFNNNNNVFKEYSS